MVTFAVATAIMLPSVMVRAAEDGKTTVNVGVTEETNSSVSYEVPLYCTLAVVDRGKGTEVVTPSKGRYYIKDTGENQGKKLAVTGLAVSTVDKGDWQLATSQEIQNANTTEKLIKLSVGGVELKQVVLNSPSKLTTLDLREKNNSFYKDNQYQLITNKLDIDIVAEVNKKYDVTATQKKETPATAQFRLYYTVSVLDENGDVKDNWSYIGPDENGVDINIVGGRK